MRYKFFAAICFLLLIALPPIALGLETQYPSVEFGGKEYTITEGTGLPELIAYVYYFILTIGGILALAVIFWGGINYFVSRESPAMVREAKKWIFGAIMGLVVLLSSWLILYTINPEFVLLREPEVRAPELITAQKEGLEVAYPVLKIFGKEYTLAEGTSLPGLIVYFYYFLLIFGGIAALGILIFGGIRYLTSAGSPTTTSEAKKYIWGALIGLTLLLSSYLILSTLNPDLTTLKEPVLEKPEIIPTEAKPPLGKPLPEAVKYAFNFAIGIGGLLAFLFLILGGIKYIVSAGNPTQMADAKNQILASIVGLLILLSAYLILVTINPQLVILKEAPLLTPPRIVTPEIETRPPGKPIFCQEFDLRGNLSAFLTNLDEAFILGENFSEFLTSDEVNLVYIPAPYGGVNFLKVPEGFKPLASTTFDLSEDCTCSAGKQICVPGCCPCGTLSPMSPFCVGYPCPEGLKILHAKFLEKIEYGENYLLPALALNIENLNMYRAELEKSLEEIKTCRSDGSKKLYTCWELKNVLGVKRQEELMKKLIGKESCDELNFYCCGK